MTKKDYIILSKIISRNTDSKNLDYIHKNTFLLDLISELKKDNPRFDSGRFTEACNQK